MKNGSQPRFIIGALKSLIKDERLHPNKKLLAIALIAKIEGYDYIYRDIVGEFEIEEKPKLGDSTTQDKPNKNARTQLLEILSSVKED